MKKYQVQTLILLLVLSCKSQAKPSLHLTPAQLKQLDGSSMEIKFKHGATLTPAQFANEKLEDKIAEKARAKAELDMQVGDYRDAILQDRIVIKCWPLDSRNYEHLAEALAANGNSKMAIKTFQYAFYHMNHGLATAGRDLRGYLIYAILMVHQGNWNEAAEAYDLEGTYPPKIEGANLPSLRINFVPNSPNPNLLLAAAHIIIGYQSMTRNQMTTGNSKYGHAFAQMKTAIKLEPNWAVAWFYYAEVLKSNHNYKQETAAFKKAIRLAGNDKTLIHDAKAEM